MPAQTESLIFSAAKSSSPCWPKVGEATGAGVSENLIGSAD
jgi:hypothetical protein